jgi:hypothetical protein
MRTGHVIATTCIALAFPASGFAAAPGAYEGKLYSIDGGKTVPSSKVTFKVKGSKLRTFRVRGGISTCVTLNVITGDLDFTFYPLAFLVPSAPVAQNKVDREYVVRDDGKAIATDTITGRFSGKSAAGRLRQKGPSSCAASYRWRARRAG